MTGQLLAAGVEWEPPTLPDGTKWDPEDEDSRHYLNGFVGKGEDCEYLNPGTNEWAKKHIAAQKRLQKRLEAKSSKRSSSKGASSSSGGAKRKGKGKGWGGGEPV